MKFKGIAIIFFLALVAALAEPLAKPHYKPQDSANIDVYHILKHLFENNEENAEDYLDLSDLNHEEEVSSSEESSSSEEEEQIAPGDLLSAPGIIRYNGYPCEEHFVTTSDGYVLGVHRIPRSPFARRRRRRQPVFLQHGLLDSSSTWVLTGRERGLAFLLADRGYDVWLGNVRGNRFSRNHTTLNPSGGRSERRQFWNFSWHEMGMIDLPTMIDYILETTGFEKLHYVGHSQGTTAFFIMASERPEYNDKIKMMHALAPVAFMRNMEGALLRSLAIMLANTESAVNLLGQFEFMPGDSIFNSMASRSCRIKAIAKGVCENAIFLALGANAEQFDIHLLPTILKNTPAGASVRQIIHYGQGMQSGRFAWYDLGLLQNIRRYGSRRPPSYRLHNVRVPVNLMYSLNDLLAAVVDVHALNDNLPNVVSLYEVPDRLFTHLDFLWGLNAKEQVYDHLIELIERAENSSL